MFATGCLRRRTGRTVRRKTVVTGVPADKTPGRRGIASPPRLMLTGLVLIMITAELIVDFLIRNLTRPYGVLIAGTIEVDHIACVPTL